MKELTFTIELLEPMLSTGLEGDPNEGVSQKFVAGSVLRGTIIGLYLKENNLSELSLDSAERELFFSEKVCYQNAYPLENNQKSLPVPLSWQTEKDAEDDADFDDFCFAERDKLKQYKYIGSPFFVLDENIIKVDPKTRLTIHTKRDAQKGRSTSDNGAVFRYESVVKGTKFKGSITSETEKLLLDIKNLINQKNVLLGGSRTAGYGLANIVCDETISDKVSGTVESIPSGEKFTITLLSNALIRDENGEFQTELTTNCLGLGDAEIEFKKVFKRAEIVGGFNRKWGLPLPQQISISAGSIFLCRAKTEISNSKVKSWLEKGIGERKTEGFGQIALNINASKSERLSFKTLTPIKLPEVDLGQNPHIKAVAQKMNERVLRRRFEEKLLEKAGKTKTSFKPKNSQISRLRLTVREAILTEDNDKIISFFSENNLRKTSREQFDKMKVEGKKLEDWIKGVLTNFPVAVEERSTPNIGNVGVSDDLTNKIKLEFNLRLIDAVLKNAAKEAN